MQSITCFRYVAHTGITRLTLSNILCGGYQALSWSAAEHPRWYPVEWPTEWVAVDNWWPQSTKHWAINTSWRVCVHKTIALRITPTHTISVNVYTCNADDTHIHTQIIIKIIVKDPVQSCTKQICPNFQHTLPWQLESLMHGYEML